MDFIQFSTQIILLFWWSCTTRAWPLTNVLISGSKVGSPYTDSVAMGIEKGMEECKTQFAWDKWNCPDQAFTKPKLLPVNREAAFVHAITAAGATYMVTKNCSLGHFENCGCSYSKPEEKEGGNWQWGGCSDNIEFGSEISKDFLDSKEHGRDPKALVTRHNYQAGRQAVYRCMKQMCKCHGVSGSCSIKTCWMQLSDFRTIGIHLRNHYDKAIRVYYKNMGRVKIKEEEMYKWNLLSLVYMETSPDYCVVNLTVGSHGTVGRECSRRHIQGSAQGKSCRSLCRDCGLKVRKQRAIVRNSCNCKFHWCCEVKCQTCTRKVNIHTCVAS